MRNPECARAMQLVGFKSEKLVAIVLSSFTTQKGLRPMTLKEFLSLPGRHRGLHGRVVRESAA